jgi:hypothetical protein
MALVYGEARTLGKRFDMSVIKKKGRVNHATFFQSFEARTRLLLIGDIQALCNVPPFEMIRKPTSRFKP